MSEFKQKRRGTSIVKTISIEPQLWQDAVAAGHLEYRSFSQLVCKALAAYLSQNAQA